MVTKNSLLNDFEAFLSSIPLEQYRTELLLIKTVEQDLPKELNPLPDIYQAYWIEERTSFLTYDEFFDRWWTNHLKPLDRFISQYFWGCSHNFVRQGFRARLYRTLISVLTQFHLGYTWKAVCNLPLNASAELDMKGIDALVDCNGTKVALQVKKETYRAEARGSGRFLQRMSQTGLVVEVPYTLSDPEQWKTRTARARNEENRYKYELFGFLATKFQRWLPNGFVVFTSQYPQLLEKLITNQVQQQASGIIGWQTVLEELKTLL